MNNWYLMPGIPIKYHKWRIYILSAYQCTLQLLIKAGVMINIQYTEKHILHCDFLHFNIFNVSLVRLLHCVGVVVFLSTLSSLSISLSSRWPFSAGMYYIDPNQGSPSDALLAYCSFSSASKQTCVHPRDSQVSRRQERLQEIASLDQWRAR